MPSDHCVLLPVDLIGDQMRRASFVIAHVCDPNDIQRPFDMYHNAHYIRERRSYHPICVREAVHREHNEEDADRQHGTEAPSAYQLATTSAPNGTSWHYTHACVGPNTSHSAHQRAIAPHITWVCSFAGPRPHEK